MRGKRSDIVRLGHDAVHFSELGCPEPGECGLAGGPQGVAGAAWSDKWPYDLMHGQGIHLGLPKSFGRSWMFGSRGPATLATATPAWNAQHVPDVSHSVILVRIFFGGRIIERERHVHAKSKLQPGGSKEKQVVERPSAFEAHTAGLAFPCVCSPRLLLPANMRLLL